MGKHLSIYCPPASPSRQLLVCAGPPSKQVLEHVLPLPLPLARLRMHRHILDSFPDGRLLNELLHSPALCLPGMVPGGQGGPTAQQQPYPPGTAVSFTLGGVLQVRGEECRQKGRGGALLVILIIQIRIRYTLLPYFGLQCRPPL